MKCDLCDNTNCWVTLNIRDKHTLCMRCATKIGFMYVSKVTPKGTVQFKPTMDLEVAIDIAKRFIKEE